jgi:hypothetical protein
MLLLGLNDRERAAQNYRLPEGSCSAHHAVNLKPNALKGIEHLSFAKALDF